MIDTAENYNPQTAVEELESQQEILLRWLENPQVTTDAEQKQAEDLLISARFALKQAEETRKELTRPLDESKKRIIELFKPYVYKLSNGIEALNRALHHYHADKVVAAEAARLAALAQEASRIATAKQNGELIQPLAKSVVPESPKTSRTHLGRVTYREDYDIQIVDPTLVPRTLCEPSMPKIRARVKSGVTDIPGVLVTRKYTTSASRQGGK